MDEFVTLYLKPRRKKSVQKKKNPEKRKERNKGEKNAYTFSAEAPFLMSHDEHDVQMWQIQAQRTCSLVLVNWMRILAFNLSKTKRDTALLHRELLLCLHRFLQWKWIFSLAISHAFANAVWIHGPLKGQMQDKFSGSLSLSFYPSTSEATFHREDLHETWLVLMTRTNSLRCHSSEQNNNYCCKL